MIDRREFLKRSGGLGLIALLPWKRQVASPPEELAEFRPAALVLPIPPIDEIEADLTRVLLWINNEPVTGIAQAELRTEPTDLQRSEYPFNPSHLRRVLEIECLWIGYPERLSKLHQYFMSAERVNLAMVTPYADGMLCRGEVVIMDFVVSKGGRPPLGLILKAKTLDEFHRFIEARITLRGIWGWTVEPLTQDVLDGLG